MRPPTVPLSPPGELLQQVLRGQPLQGHIVLAVIRCPALKVGKGGAHE